MAGLTTQVVPLDLVRAESLRNALDEAGFTFHEVAHARFAAKGEGVSAVYYESRKLVLQGKDLREFLERWLPEALPKPPEVEDAMIGADEAGKGDYFGPLVTAACLLEPDVARFLDEVPLRDSKTLSPSEIETGAEMLRRTCQHEIVVIGPAKYNELYAKFRNLNSLLAWAHKTAILGLVKKSGCKKILLDKFADESVMKRAFGAEYAGLDFTMRTKAESEPAVAAASILARDAFVRGVRRLSKQIGFTLPLGAGDPVDRAVRNLVAQKGEAILPEVAKMHFKTTEKAGRRRE
jgi:ribonuclease HIII